MMGNEGNDDIFGGPGPDRLAGGRGDDRIRSIDGIKDVTVTCGDGRDRLAADRLDVVRSCEKRVKADLRGASLTRVPAASY